MRRYLLALCGVALLSASSLSAQALLPARFGKWSKGPCADKPATTTFAAEAKQHDNVSCQYSAEGQTITVWAGSFQDSSAAYEVFTGWLTPEMLPTKVGQAAAFDKSGVIAQTGNIVVRSTANISKDDLNDLLKALEAKSERAPLPPVRTYLPAEGRLVGSERYALGPEALKTALAEALQPEMPALVNAIGFGKAADAEAMLARYSLPGKGSGVLLLLEYPTPNVAEQHIHHLAEVLPPGANQGEESILRKGSLLSIVLSASSPEYAKSLREASNYETEVTWNEPSQTLTDPPLTSTMVKIFIGTGVFMVSAIVLGIAFGGVRIITKRLLPGKVFDRPAQMEVLQLGLTSKPIDPSDLY